MRDDDGVLTLTMPMATGKLPGISVEDIGRFAYEVFHRRDEFVGREIAISGENLTGFEIAAKFAVAVGEEVRYNPISLESYRGLGFRGERAGERMPRRAISVALTDDSDEARDHPVRDRR